VKHAALLESTKLQDICITIADKTGCNVAIMGPGGRIIAPNPNASASSIPAWH